MKIVSIPRLDARENADLLIFPFWEGPVEAAQSGHLKQWISSLLSTGDFRGKVGESALLYADTGKEKRLLLLGLGPDKDATVEGLRRAYAGGVKIAGSKKVKSINLVLPHHSHLPKDAIRQGVFEGVLLTNYAFNRLKNEALKDSPPLLKTVGGVGLDPQDETWIDRAKKRADGVYLARDLVNGNADEITAQALADTALSLEKNGPKVKTTVYDKKWLEQQKMGLILAVNRGSHRDPFLIQVSYRGDPHSKDHVVFVGKGVTYDTGGLALKPLDGMLSMKADMAGAAAVLGALQVASQLDLKVNVTALIPAVENCIDAESYKPGDVYHSYLGKTVEVNNTDAEGRLILADALAYAVRALHPTCLIDLATLTGSIVVALGPEYAGLFTSHSSLADDLLSASDTTGELLWRMPLVPEYKESLKSEIADLLNTGGKEGGSITAALFLQEFVGSVPWAHVDIAGPAFLAKPKTYSPTKATGFGVRLLTQFLERRHAH